MTQLNLKLKNKYNKIDYGKCCPQKKARCPGCEGIPFPFYTASLSYENDEFRCYLCCDTGLDKIPLSEVY